MTTKKEQEFLMQLAKDAIFNYPKAPSPDLNKISSALKQKRGVFVTLEINGQLRGCIGTIEPIMPLYKAIIENAINAAYSDPRFPPLAKEEFNKVTIEISILTVPSKLNYTGPSDLFKKLNHEQGIIIKKGFATATFLPQVWEQLPDKQEFLTHLCLKANLSPEAWKDKDTEIYAYKVEKFVQ